MLSLCSTGLGPNETNTTVELSPQNVFSESPSQILGNRLPLPTVVNFNTSEAFLVGDEFGGVQAEDAGTYICVVNGRVRETVDIVVLGKQINAKYGCKNQNVICAVYSFQCPNLLDHQLSSGSPLFHWKSFKLAQA